MKKYTFLSVQIPTLTASVEPPALPGACVPLTSDKWLRLEEGVSYLSLSGPAYGLPHRLIVLEAETEEQGKRIAEDIASLDAGMSRDLYVRMYYVHNVSDLKVLTP